MDHDHDSLCGLSNPCDDETPEHGYCMMSHGQFCIHCNKWCICPQLQQAKEEVARRIIEMADVQAEVAAAMASDDMLAKCMAAVEDLFGPDDYELRWLLDGQAVLAALRALEEQP